MDNSLDELIYKEEILEICFWYQGEGFGNEFTAQALSPFLNQPTEKVESVLQELCGTGRMEQTARGSYQFLEAGTQEGGQLFVESFNEMQQPGHYECVDGCCDGDDHSRCKHH